MDAAYFEEVADAAEALAIAVAERTRDEAAGLGRRAAPSAVVRLAKERYSRALREAFQAAGMRAPARD